MKRYTVETDDPYDMTEDPAGMWVMHDEIVASVDASSAAASR